MIVTRDGRGPLRSFSVDGVLDDEPVWARWDGACGLTGDAELLARADVSAGDRGTEVGRAPEVGLLLRLVRSCDHTTKVVFDFDAMAEVGERGAAGGS